MKVVRGLSLTRAGGPACRGAAALLLLTGLAIPQLGYAAGSGLSVSHAWMRFIIHARPAAGYFSLTNGTDKALQLVGAASPACGMLMLHQSKEVNGVEMMRPVKSVTVPAHGSIAFKPGHYHLMCMKPAASMRKGGSVPVTLKFADHAAITAAFPVRGPGDR